MAHWGHWPTTGLHTLSPLLWLYSRRDLWYGVPFVKICEVNGVNACMTCQVSYVACHVFYIFLPWFIYLCHDLYIIMPCFIFVPCFNILCHDLNINAMFYVFIPCFIIYLCQFRYMLHHYSFMLHQDFHFCCIVFSHLCCINTNLCCINTTNLCCIKICQQLHFFHHPIQWEVIITCSIPVVLPTLQDLT